MPLHTALWTLHDEEINAFCYRDKKFPCLSPLVHWAIWNTEHFTLHTVHRELYTNYTLNHAQCTLYTAHSTYFFLLYTRPCLEKSLLRRLQDHSSCNSTKRPKSTGSAKLLYFLNQVCIIKFLGLFYVFFIKDPYAWMILFLIMEIFNNKTKLNLWSCHIT